MLNSLYNTLSGTIFMIDNSLSINANISQIEKDKRKKIVNDAIFQLLNWVNKNQDIHDFWYEPIYNLVNNKNTSKDFKLTVSGLEPFFGEIISHCNLQKQIDKKVLANKKINYKASFAAKLCLLDIFVDSKAIKRPVAFQCANYLREVRNSQIHTSVNGDYHSYINNIFAYIIIVLVSEQKYQERKVTGKVNPITPHTVVNSNVGLNISNTTKSNDKMKSIMDAVFKSFKK